MEPRKPYPTDLTDKEWASDRTLCSRGQAGRAAGLNTPSANILNGICYILRGGCAWRLLPHDFPPGDR